MGRLPRTQRSIQKAEVKWLNSYFFGTLSWLIIRYGKMFACCLRSEAKLKVAVTMPLSLPQLTLALFDEAHVNFADYVPGQNQLVVDALSRWVAADGPWYVMLWGGSGTGKSHLIQSSLRAVDEQKNRAMYVPLREVMDFEPAILDDLETIEYLAIDDVHLVAGNAAWELALFNLFNRMLGAGVRLLISSARGPQNLDVDLPDLTSRLNSGLIYRLAELDDDDKQAVLQRRANRRGLLMPDNVARYLIHRLRRDMRELNTIFERIDAASLSTGRELTIPFVRDVLGLD